MHPTDCSCANPKYVERIGGQLKDGRKGKRQTREKKRSFFPFFLAFPCLALFDALIPPPPPLLTCVSVCLTFQGKDSPLLSVYHKNRTSDIIESTLDSHAKINIFRRCIYKNLPAFLSNGGAPYTCSVCSNASQGQE